MMDGAAIYLSVLVIVYYFLNWNLLGRVRNFNDGFFVFFWMFLGFGYLMLTCIYCFIIEYKQEIINLDDLIILGFSALLAGGVCLVNMGFLWKLLGLCLSVKNKKGVWR